MDLKLKGKKVLVTGSTKGLGKAVSELFAAEGADVIITGRNESEVCNLAKEISQKYSVNAVGIQTDLAREGAAEELFEKSLKVFSTLDILVNNAGIWKTAYVEQMKKKEFEDTLYFNLEVPYILSQLMVKQCREKNIKGKIINIVSQAAFHGSTTGHAHYAASKSGLVAFTISLAREVAQYGINVNAVAPGLMETPMIQKAYSEKKEYYDSRIPLGYVAKPEQIAYPVIFLGSEKADYLTGITIDATGGMLMR